MKNLKRPPVLASALLTGLLLSLLVASGAQADAQTSGYAWSTTTGWIHFAPEHGGVTVYSDHLEGYAWGENVGWIRLGVCTGGSPCSHANTSATDYGVNNDGAGNLSGYAWSTTAGWISFAPDGGGVTIDPVTGDFDGYAWGENVGWIHFRNDAPAYGVNTSWRGQAPLITSADHATFLVGSAGTFTVTATGLPTPTLAYSGTLPVGVTFTDNGDGTATLAGTPAVGSGGVYSLTFTASNGVPPDATQPFTLTVNTKVYLPLVLRNAP